MQKGPNFSSSSVEECKTDLVLSNILQIKSFSELKEKFGKTNGVLIQQNKEEGYGEFFIDGKGTLFFTIEKDKITFIGNNLGEEIYKIVSFFKEDSNFQMEGSSSRFLYYTDNKKAITDTKGNYLSKVGGNWAYNIYDKKTFNFIECCFLEEGVPVYIKNENGEKIEGITEIYDDGFKIRGSNRLFSYNLKTKKAITDIAGNYLRKRNNVIYEVYNKDNFEFIECCFLEEGVPVYIKNEEGDKIEGITEISGDEFKISGFNWSFGYNPKTKKVLTNTDGNYLHEKYGEIFKIYNKDNFEFMECYFLEEGVPVYIKNEEGEKITGIIDIYALSNTFKISGSDLMFLYDPKTKKAITDTKGNYLSKVGENLVYNIYDKKTFNFIECCLLEEGAPVYIKNEEGEKITGIIDICPLSNTFKISGSNLRFSYNGRTKRSTISTITYKGNKFMTYNGKYFIYSSGKLNKIFDIELIAELEKIKLDGVEDAVLGMGEDVDKIIGDTK